MMISHYNLFVEASTHTIKPDGKAYATYNNRAEATTKVHKFKYSDRCLKVEGP